MTGTARNYPEYRGGRMKSKYLVLFLLLSFLFTACQTVKDDDGILLEDEGLKNTLSIELVGHDSNSLLYQKIMSFAEKQPNLEVRLRSNPDGYDTPSAWVLGGEESGDPPDILELTPNQMKMFFHHGKIESLGLQEPQYQDYLIHSPDGYILGVKTKINPLVLYYNQDIFRQHGLEYPTNEWDWAQFEQTITVLKEKEENYLSAPRITSYSGIMEQNERISIAPLPGGNGVINPALMSGLAIHTGSKNKEGAMKLLRYLLEESDDFYQDTVVQTHQVGAKGALLNKDTEEWSVLLQEVTRSVPVSLMMNEGSQWANSIAQIRLNKLYRAMKNGQPAKEVLEGYAEEFDMQFEEFKEDLNNYSRYTNWI